MKKIFKAFYGYIRRANNSRLGFGRYCVILQVRIADVGHRRYLLGWCRCLWPCSQQRCLWWKLLPTV